MLKALFYYFQNFEQKFSSKCGQKIFASRIKSATDSLKTTSRNPVAKKAKTMVDN